MLSSKKKWWASSGDSHYEIGPCKTRNDVIEEAIAERLGEDFDPEVGWFLSFTICQAEQNVDITKGVDVDQFLSYINEYMLGDCHYEEEKSDIFEELTESDTTLLQSMLEDTLRQWQKMIDKTFSTYEFQSISDEEAVTHIIGFED